MFTIPNITKIIKTMPFTSNKTFSLKIYIAFLVLLSFVSTYAQTKSGTDPVIQKTPSNTAIERRFAWVIGNKDYSDHPLTNPLNDAEEMKSSLEDLGFKVMISRNIDLLTFKNDLIKFTNQLTPSDVVFIYYSGHGLSYNGVNYLLPLKAEISCFEQIGAYCMSLNDIIKEVSYHQVKNSFYILDACRGLPQYKNCSNNLLPKGTTANNGFVYPTNNPPGSMIVYATDEGSTAIDRKDDTNSIFTGSLLRYLKTPNIGIRTIIDRTTIEVDQRTKFTEYPQYPARYDKLTGDFYFIKTKDLLPFEPQVVFVQGGSFEMGNKGGFDDEKPVHEENLKDFHIGRFEITLREYLVFVNEVKNHYPIWLEENSIFNIDNHPNSVYKISGYSRENNLDLPIIGISWDDANAYCDWLSKKTGKVYRLPTEAEWEYAVRGGKYSRGFPYSGSKDINQVAWDDGNPHPVGGKRPNELGIYDMSGNVWEWCDDCYNKYSSVAQEKSSDLFIQTTCKRILRGSPWLKYPIENPLNFSVFFRKSEEKEFKTWDVGFRVVQEPYY